MRDVEEQLQVRRPQIGGHELAEWRTGALLESRQTMCNTVRGGASPWLIDYWMVTIASEIATSNGEHRIFGIALFWERLPSRWWLGVLLNTSLVGHGRSRG